MRVNDQQVGIPETIFKDTKANIEALANPVEGMIAYATDTNQFGSYNGASWDWGSGGATTFLGLTDTPASYTGQAGKYPKVNVGETALEFATPAGTGDVVGPSSAVNGNLAVFDGATGKLIKDGGAVPSGGYTQGARVYHNANQNISNDTSTTLAFNSERYDTDVIHDTVTNNSRLTCKTAGKYLITVNVQFAAASGGIRQIWMLLNGATIIAFSNMVEPGGGFSARINLSTIYDLAVNDYVECVVYQISGGTIVVSSVGNYSPEFMMQRIG